MGWRVGILGGAAALLAMLVGAQSAFACSCVNAPEVKRLKGSDAAAVLKLVDVVSDPGGSGNELHYRVRRVHKGERWLQRGDSLVLEADPLNSCSLPTKKRRYAIYLERRKGEFSAGLCDVTGRRKMRRAARKLDGRAGAAGSASRSGRCGQQAA